MLLTGVACSRPASVLPPALPVPGAARLPVGPRVGLEVVLEVGLVTRLSAAGCRRGGQRRSHRQLPGDILRGGAVSEKLRLAGHAPDWGGGRILPSPPRYIHVMRTTVCNACSS